MTFISGVLIAVVLFVYMFVGDLFAENQMVGHHEDDHMYWPTRLFYTIFWLHYILGTAVVGLFTWWRS